MSYVVWSVSPAVMRYEKIGQEHKLLWHYFWNQCGRRPGRLTMLPEQCARDLGIAVEAVYAAGMTLADVGLLTPFEEPDGIPATGVAEPQDDIYLESEPRWVRWKVPSIVLSNNELEPGPKLVYLYLWNKAGARPGRMTIDPKELADFFNVPESTI